jgi:hypothetical protein
MKDIPIVRPQFSIPHNFLLLKRGILQFVVVKAVLTPIVAILRLCGRYEEGVISVDTGYIYISVIYNFSIAVSMYCLVLFYVTTRFDLVERNPMPKFLCIKVHSFLS